MADDRYSHGHHESVLRSHRWRTAQNSAAFLLPRLESSMAMLDVGCGPGTITADFAELLADGSVVGLDRSPEVIAGAREEHGGANLTFEVGDVYHLDFPDERFDVVFAHQVLQHLASPVAALSEMRRVLRPGGLLAVRDADFGAFAWAPLDPMLERWMDVYHEITRHNGATADAGRFLKAWVMAAGFEDLSVTSATWTYETASERSWWGELWADRVVHSEFARQGVEYGVTTLEELAEIAAAFRRWADEPTGVFILLHGEVVATR